MLYACCCVETAEWVWTFDSARNESAHSGHHLVLFSFPGELSARVLVVGPSSAQLSLAQLIPSRCVEKCYLKLCSNSAFSLSAAGAGRLWGL